MHTLYPPLEEPQDGRPLDMNNGSPQEGALSRELREHFETMQDLHDRTILMPGTHGDECAEDEALKAKKLEMATKTAIAVEQEMSRLQNGIAELEQLLARQEGEDAVDLEPFPELPRVVAIVRDEPEDTDDVVG